MLDAHLLGLMLDKCHGSGSRCLEGVVGHVTIYLANDCDLQALMGGRQFCAMLQRLQAAGPAFTPTELPTLHAFAALAAEFLQAASPDTPGG